MIPSRQRGCPTLTLATCLKSSPYLRGVVILLLSGLVAHAQIESGAFVGTVKDPSGAVIPDAKITITNQSTNVRTLFETDSSGVYRVGNLIPGIYNIKVEARGFKTITSWDVELTVGAVQRVDFKMELGDATQTVTVEASAPLVNTEEGRLSTLVEASQVANLPLHGRNIYQLINVAPGAVDVTGVMFGERANTVVNGARQTFSGFWMDGVANTGLSGDYITLPNPDIVQEFRISTLNMSAEYGKSAGSVTTIVTKAGTNQFHGTVYEYFRNEALNATDFFRNRTGCTLGEDPFCNPPARGDGRGNLDKAPLRFNQFGLTLGGPVRRDKTFFFASYQGDRTRTYAPAYPITLEAPEWREAVRKALPNSVAALLYTDFPGPSGKVLNTVDEFVEDNYGSFGILVCPDYFGPRIASNFQQLFGVTEAESGGCPTALPVSQRPEQVLNRGLPFQISSVALLPTQASIDGLLFQGNSWSARIDHNFAEGDRLFGRLYWQEQTDEFGYPSAPTRNALRGFENPTAWSFPNVVLAWTHIFSPTMVNEVRGGFARRAFDLEIKVAPGVPEIDFVTDDVGFGSYSGYPQYFHENVYTYSDLLSLARGKHGVKVGVEFRRNQDNSDFNVGRPFYVFFDNLFFAADASFYEGAGVDPGIVTGQPARLATNNRAWRNWEVGAFIQDDWKVTPHLTLNLGLRYDLYGRITEKFGRETQFILGQGADITERVQNANIPAGLPGCDTPEQIRLAQLAGVCGPGGFATADILGAGDHDNFSPRFGFAWSPGSSGRTSIRGGFGVAYQAALFNPLSNSRWNLPYYSLNEASNFLIGDVNNVVYGPHTLDANGNVVFDPAAQPSFAGPATNPGQGVGAQAAGNLDGWDPNNPNLAGLTAIVDPDGLRDPYVYSFFFGVQRELIPNLLFEVDYVGSAGRKLFSAQSFNRVRGGLLPIPGMCLDSQGETVCSRRDTTVSPVTGSFVNPVGRVNPNYGNLRVWQNTVNSSYNSLQVSARRKMSRGLAFTANYTWSHSIDSDSDWHMAGLSLNGTAAGDGYSLDIAHPELDRGHSTFDIRHRLALTQVWELPWAKDRPGLVGHLLGGWQLNSIWVFQTGAHWTAFDQRPRNLLCSGGSNDGFNANSSSGASTCLDGGGAIVNLGGDFNLDGENNDRPDPAGSNTIHATRDQWAEGFFGGTTGAYDGGFLRPACLGCNGALGRNTLVGPGLFQADISIFKRFHLTERVSLQFRSEFFNAFNRANFQPPRAFNGGNSANSPIFGQAFGTFDPREIQFALKLSW